MNDREIVNFKETISARIKNLLNQSIATAQSRETIELDQHSIGRLSRMDAIERKAMADATNRMRQLEVEQLLAAQKRLDRGEYGYCVDCGDEIERKRLTTNLTVLKCMDCANG